MSPLLYITQPVGRSDHDLVLASVSGHSIAIAPASQPAILVIEPQPPPDFPQVPLVLSFNIRSCVPINLHALKLLVGSWFDWQVLHSDLPISFW